MKKIFVFADKVIATTHCMTLILKCNCVFSIDKRSRMIVLKLRRLVIYRLFYDCLTYLIVISSGRHNSRSVLSTTALSTHFYLIDAYRMMQTAFSYTNIRVNYIRFQFCAKPPCLRGLVCKNALLPVNSGTDVARSRTWNAKRQFGTVPGIPGRLAILVGYNSS